MGLGEGERWRAGRERWQRRRRVVEECVEVIVVRLPLALTVIVWAVVRECGGSQAKGTQQQAEGSKGSGSYLPTDLLYLLTFRIRLSFPPASTLGLGLGVKG